MEEEEEMWGVRAAMFQDVVENPVCETAVFDCFKYKESKSFCS